jgi:hypothetical protein
MGQNNFEKSTTNGIHSKHKKAKGRSLGAL